MDSSSLLHKNICGIVVDESHTVENWTGKRYKKVKGFRDAYGQLSILRSLCKPGRLNLSSDHIVMKKNFDSLWFKLS